MSEEQVTRRCSSFQDRTGQVFDRLTVLSLAPRRGTAIYWLCLCKCGNKKEIRATHLAAIGSCGCLRTEAVAAALTTHGHAGSGRKRSPEYRTWSHMLGRCYCESDKAYKYYGERGITVCARWRESFQAFLDDVGRRPSVQHSIDRIDTNGNYEPGNCRWSTRTVQTRNKRNNRFFTHNGETLCMADWARRYGLSNKDLQRRIDGGWDFEEALTTPVKRRTSV